MSQNYGYDAIDLGFEIQSLSLPLALVIPPYQYRILVGSLSLDLTMTMTAKGAGSPRCPGLAPTVERVGKATAYGSLKSLAGAPTQMPSCVPQ